jgi:hypothetical protein
MYKENQQPSSHKPIILWKASLLFGLLAFTGFTIYISIDSISSRIEFDENHIEINGLITDISETNRTCVNIDNCKCIDTDVRSCTGMARDYDAGQCRKETSCCDGSINNDPELHYRRLSKSGAEEIFIVKKNELNKRRLYGGVGGVGGGLSNYGRSGSSCDRLDAQECTSSLGTCYEPIISFEYEYDSVEYTNLASKECGFDDHHCVDEFLGLRRSGELATIYLDKNNPTDSSLNEQEFALSSYQLGMVIAMPILTAIFFVGFCCAAEGKITLY